MFQAESDDETTDGWCATHEEMEEAGGRKREDGSELEEWEGGGGDAGQMGPKCVVTMIPTQSDQLAAVGTNSGPFGALRSCSPS